MKIFLIHYQFSSYLCGCCIVPDVGRQRRRLFQTSLARIKIFTLSKRFTKPNVEWRSSTSKQHACKLNFSFRFFLCFFFIFACFYFCFCFITKDMHEGIYGQGGSPSVGSGRRSYSHQGLSTYFFTL